jgi:hypothetical protein
VAEPKWKQKNNGRWTERPKETTKQWIKKKTESNIERIQQMSNKKEKEKRGRPEEENFSQETGLPGYPTDLTSVHMFPHKH